METQIAQNVLITEHISWLNYIDHSKQELREMQNRLIELAPFFSNKMLVRVEQFQNRFIRQKEVTDILRHNIKAHENDIERMTRLSLDYLQLRVTNDHLALKNEFKTYVELFVELVQDFNEFLA
jgi:ABC-type molybdate transport system ATPase subunit